jgi:hypothetical protein
VANANGGGVSIHLGTGNGSFATPTSEVIDGNPFGLIRADLNGDEVDDLVAAVPGRDEVVVMVGNGNATFSKTTYAAGDYPIRLAVADLDGDGDADIAASSSNSGAIAIMRNLCIP